MIYLTLWEASDKSMQRNKHMYEIRRVFVLTKIGISNCRGKEDKLGQAYAWLVQYIKLLRSILAKFLEIEA